MERRKKRKDKTKGGNERELDGKGVKTVDRRGAVKECGRK